MDKTEDNRMREEKKTIKSLNIDPALFFLGTEEEINEAEEKEARRGEEIKKLVTSTGFLALEYNAEHGQQVVLHSSPRRGARYQLSYIDADGEACGHENFIATGEELNEAIHTAAELWRHFTDLTTNKDLTLTIYRE